MKSARESAQVFIEQELRWLYDRLDQGLSLAEEVYIINRLHELELHP